jgi:NTP pyrophosphatase (non-canonical NTP hydrolase)
MMGDDTLETFGVKIDSEQFNKKQKFTGNRSNVEAKIAELPKGEFVRWGNIDVKECYPTNNIEYNKVEMNGSNDCIVSGSNRNYDIKMNNDVNWLMQAVVKEDNCDISVGGLITDMKYEIVTNIIKRLDNIKNHRTVESSLIYLMSEVGELADESSKKNGFSIKEIEEDGLFWEAIDVIVTALDVIQLNEPSIKGAKIISAINTKITKWEKKNIIMNADKV